MYILGTLPVAQHIKKKGKKKRKKKKNKNKKNKTKKKREEKMEGRKKAEPLLGRAYIHIRLLGGARQGEREIKEGQRRTNMKKKKEKSKKKKKTKGKEMCKRLGKFLDGVERLENKRRK